MTLEFRLTDLCRLQEAVQGFELRCPNLRSCTACISGQCPSSEILISVVQLQQKSTNVIFIEFPLSTSIS